MTRPTRSKRKRTDRKIDLDNNLRSCKDNDVMKFVISSCLYLLSLSSTG